jgi:uncharacterized membrane protein YphA (DoxX/SURF4 family)
VPRPSKEATATVHDAVSLILRLPLGVMLIWSGVQRLLSMPTATPDLPNAASVLSPEAVSAMLTGLPYAELLGGALLALGFLGRVGAGLAMVSLVSLCLLYGWGDQSAPFSPRLIYLSVAAATLLLGSGMLSADYIAFGQKRSGR